MVSRWQTVSSKNAFWARLAKLLTVHGALGVVEDQADIALVGRLC